jgi:hypothetical protein
VKKKRKADTAAFMLVAEAPLDRMTPVAYGEL